MRNSDNISLPHPVLGNSNDITGFFSVDLSCSIKNQKLKLKAEKVNINNEYFNKLIDDKKAAIVYKISCNSTLYMKQIQGDLDEEIECSLLSNKLVVDMLIIAIENIDEYSDVSFHEDTALGKNKGVFKVKKGAVIGVAGIVTIPLTDEYKKGLSGIIEFQEGEPDSPIAIDADGSKIIITYPYSPNNQNMVTTFTSGRKKYVNIFLNLFLIPALSEAFRFLIESIDDNTYDEKVEQCDWARIIDENMLDSIDKNDSPYELAQLFLRDMTKRKTGASEPMPVFSAFNEIY